MRSVRSQAAKFLNYCHFKPLFAVQQPHTEPNRCRVRRVQVQFARNEDSIEQETPSTYNKSASLWKLQCKIYQYFPPTLPPSTQYIIPAARRNTKNFSPSVFLDHCQKFYFFLRERELNYCTSPQLTTTFLHLKRAEILKKEENFDHHKGGKKR